MIHKHWISISNFHVYYNFLNIIINSLNKTRSYWVGHLSQLTDFAFIDWGEWVQLLCEPFVTHHAVQLDKSADLNPTLGVSCQCNSQPKQYEFPALLHGSNLISDTYFFLLWFTSFFHILFLMTEYILCVSEYHSCFVCSEHLTSNC